MYISSRHLHLESKASRRKNYSLVFNVLLQNSSFLSSVSFITVSTTCLAANAQTPLLYRTIHMASIGCVRNILVLVGQATSDTRFSLV